jgi:hypothetical protein
MGPAQVDMNKYNLPFEDAEQWTANVVPASFRKKKAFIWERGTTRPCLSTLSRLSSHGTGSTVPDLASEVAGGREDGTGIDCFRFADGTGRGWHCAKAIPLSRWR